MLSHLLHLSKIDHAKGQYFANNGQSSQSYGFPKAAVKSLQSSPTLCNPIDGSPPGSPVPGILQARPLVWVAISFSNA